jgi:uncharacterized protein (TIRG00374 family)
VAGSLGVALVTLWWQAQQLGGIGGINDVLLLPALGFALVSFTLRIARFHLFLVALGARVPFGASVRAQFAGFSLSMTPGKVGELYKCYLIEQRTGVPTARTAPILLFEKGMDALAFSILAVATAAILPNIAGSINVAARSLAAVGIVLILGVLMLRAARPDQLTAWLMRVVGRNRRGRRVVELFRLTLAGGADLLKPAILGGNMALSLVARTCDGLTLTLAAAALGVNIPALAGIFVLNSSGALGGASMLPGGVGVVEASMSVLLAGFGASTSAALAAALVARFLSFWLWVAIGLVVLVRTGIASDGARVS